MLLLAVFVTVPVILYSEFRAADREQQALLLNVVREQGRLVAEGLRPLLAAFNGRNVSQINDVLARFASGSLRIRLLLRAPGKTGSNSFFYIGVQPKVSSEFLDRDRQELINTGILGRLGPSCAIGAPEVIPHRNPAGEEEVLTAIVPMETESGCWVVILSNAADRFFGTSLGRPYWDSAEIRLAAVIYVMMAFFVLALFLGVWRSLRRFATLARELSSRRPGKSQRFVSLVAVPELRGVAAEFDRLVDVLHRTADAIRLAAHENAHALKTPLAIISQSLEPLRRHLAAGDTRARAAYGRIEKAVRRLDALVSAAQRMDQAIAESIRLERTPVDLSSLVQGLVDTYAGHVENHGVRLQSLITPGIVVNANEDAVELLLENIIENARGFSPPGGSIFVTLTRDGGTAEIAIEDEGPGIDPAQLERVFERYFSTRPAGAESANEQADTHFGIGLWIVRRNVEALGGTVGAENRPEGGLRVRVRLPAVG